MVKLSNLQQLQENIEIRRRGLNLRILRGIYNLFIYGSDTVYWIRPENMHHI